MVESAEANEYHLALNSHCDVPTSALQGLGNLLLALLPLAQIPHLEHLAEVLVIGNGLMHETMRELARQDIAYYIRRDVLPSTAPATAVPVITNEGLRCFVVLEERLIRPLTPEDYRSGKRSRLFSKNCCTCVISADSLTISSLQTALCTSMEGMLSSRFASRRLPSIW